MQDTIDYQTLLQIIQKKMSTPVELLETLIQEIAQETKTTFPNIQYFKLSIQKQNPPLGAKVRSSEVMLEERY